MMGTLIFKLIITPYLVRLFQGFPSCTLSWPIYAFGLKLNRCHSSVPLKAFRTFNKQRRGDEAAVFLFSVH